VTTLEILKATRDLLDGGRCWYQGGSYPLVPAPPSWCLVAAIREVTRRGERQSAIANREAAEASQFLAGVLNPGATNRDRLISFSDNSKTTWPDIRELLDQAIEAAKEQP
jgi:hypothetical protein